MPNARLTREAEGKSNAQEAEKRRPCSGLGLGVADLHDEVEHHLLDFYL